MEFLLKRASYTCIFKLVVTCVLCIALLRTILIKKPQPPAPCLFQDNDYVNESRGLSGRLAQACRFRTITDRAHSFNTSALISFREYIERTFPLIHSSSSINKELVNNYSLLYMVKGENPALKPYMLVGHLDVVPAVAARWDVDAFGGIVQDGYIYGRGTIDCKNVVMGVLEALEFLLERKYKPARSFYIAFGHDEEGQGYNGAAAIGKLLVSRNVQLEYLLDEGLFVLDGIIPGVTIPSAIVGVTEKGYLSINLSVVSEAGHSSSPSKESAIVILAKAIAKLEGDVQPNFFGYGPEVKMLEEAAPYAAFPFRFVYANLWLFSRVVAWVFGLKPQTSANIRTTTAVTLISGGTKENVIPSSAWAVVNHRTHPAQSVSNVIQYDRDLISDDRVNLEVMTYTDPHPISPCDADTFGYQILKETIQQIYSNAAVLPGLMVGNTDSKWYLNLTSAIYRFSPTHMHLRDTIRFHGDNERISVKNYEQVVNFYHHLIMNSDRRKLEPLHVHSEF